MLIPEEQPRSAGKVVSGPGPSQPRLARRQRCRVRERGWRQARATSPSSSRTQQSAIRTCFPGGVKKKIINKTGELKAFLFNNTFRKGLFQGVLWDAAKVPEHQHVPGTQATAKVEPHRYGASPGATQRLAGEADLNQVVTCETELATLINAKVQDAGPL